MSEPTRLEGLKQLVAFVEEVTGRRTSKSAISRAIDPRRRGRLPAQFTPGGHVYADPAAVRAWALESGGRQRKRRRAR